MNPRYSLRLGARRPDRRRGPGIGQGSVSSERSTSSSEYRSRSRSSSPSKFTHFFVNKKVSNQNSCWAMTFILLVLIKCHNDTCLFCHCMLRSSNRYDRSRLSTVFRSYRNKKRFICSADLDLNNIVKNPTVFCFK
jgi:hypothetical protein